jgi:hypothetical protein
MKTIHIMLSALLTFSAFSWLNAATQHYCLSYRDDPSTTIVIGWGGDNGTVYYGTADLGTAYASYPNNHASDRTGSVKGHTRHFARLTGLTPNTMYYFVIRDNANQTSARFKFKTLSDNPNDPVSYINGGDSRDGFKTFGVYIENCPSGNCLEKRRDGNKLVAKIRPDFVAFNGDYIMNQITSNPTNEWNDWFTDWQLTISTDGRIYPTLHTQGNHEDNADMYQMFDIPQVEYYSVNINNGLLRIYLLNSELNACSNTSQLTWLSNDLQLHSTGGSSDPTWKFVQYHIPTFAMGNGYGLVADQMSCWVNLFEQYGVRMVSESHTHITKWTHPCKANSGKTDFVTSMSDGIVYIGEGQWGAPHRTLDFTGANKKPYVRDQEVFDNFFYITVTPQQTTIRCVKFENVNGVTASTDDNLGHDLPAGVVLWNPSNGNQVILINDNAPAAIDERASIISSAYPNPTNNLVTISFATAVKDASLEIYNGLGQLCTKETINGTQHTLDLTDACSGVHYIYIRTQEGTVESRKVVKF